MKAVFYHKPDSRYDDVQGERYHFPHIYLSRVKRVIGDWMVYYGPEQGMPGRFYTGIAKVSHVTPDPARERHYYALLENYLDFDRPVEYKEGGGFEKRLVQPDGVINNGYKVQAVRSLEESEFAAIVRAGLSEPDEWPDRYDNMDEDGSEPYSDDIFQEPPQSALAGEPYDRPILEQITRRKWRDRKFRKHVRIAYDRTCAFTGLRLINGRGRPEVEAAHIRPVEKGGNDWVRNGIALSGTVHWMFDRGLLSLADDFTILRSRQLNHDVSHLLNKDLKARVPSDPRLQPHPEYLGWHRTNIFKG
ncbi:HNH endonuclease [Oricola thermophila]|uniref:HNH endonuclease n=1 Tax=Oricola thermophila TaxID=2742145 RepID=UPI001FE683A3|nr:HNH endonuclease [Oricola thermophila]